MIASNIFANGHPHVQGDTRGVIADVFYSHPVDHVAVIKSGAGAIRGNHYHKLSTQHTLVISGVMEYWHRVEAGPIQLHVARAGDLLTSPPGEVHAMCMRSDTELVVFSEGVRGGTDYEADTFRVDSIVGRKKTAVVFGASGGIGQAVVSKLREHGYAVLGLHRHDVDVRDGTKVSAFLWMMRPDVVVNCAGVFDAKFREMFAVNVGANWNIVQHYAEKRSIDPVRVVMIGSSAYSSGRKDYALYAASKAALHNMVQGAQEMLRGTDISISLLHPARVNTRMSPSGDGLEPGVVADAVLEMCLRKGEGKIEELRA